MKLLNKETVLSTVAGWAVDRLPAWTAADLDAVCAKLSEISHVVTPHLVADVPLSSDEMQAALLARTLTAIDDWLIRGAASVCQSLRLGPILRTGGGQPALGLRSATEAELDALDGIGRERAAELARTLALHPEIRDMDDLDAVEGVGTVLLNRLKSAAYLDHAQAALVSPSLLAFALAPTVSRYLTLLDHTDLELCYGDANTLARRPPAGGAPTARFLGLLSFVQGDAQRRLSPASGALASQARRELSRSALCQRYLENLQPSDGALIVNDDYVPAMLDLIAAATDTVRMAVFVATASRKETDAFGSQAIIDALAARAAAGVSVRVLLDRDRPEDPYHSTYINRAVIKRLSTAGAIVKQDAPATLLHSKFLVSDTASVIVGSHNLTTASIADIHEVSVRLDSTHLAEAFAARFDALWQG